MIYDNITIKFPANQITGGTENVYLKIMTDSLSRKTLKTQTISYDDNDLTSKAKNGTREFEYAAVELLVGEKKIGSSGQGVDDKALAAAKDIVNEYRDGREYVEAEWAGNPGLTPGKTFVASEPVRSITNAGVSTQYTGASSAYVALAGEIRLEDGLRMKTKARSTDN